VWVCGRNVPPSVVEVGALLTPLSGATTLAGFNVESVEYKSVNFTVWDVGGQKKSEGDGVLSDACIRFKAASNRECAS
jgi:hypothetical protein